MTTTMTQSTVSPMRWVLDDGGRSDAGFRGEANDCVARAISIATGHTYADTYRALAAANAASGGQRSARNRIPKSVIRDYLAELGWDWTPTMHIGSGCKVHLVADELPPGRLICSLSRHLAAVIDGVVHDTADPTRDGSRCVYGYWTKTPRSTP